MFEVLVGQQVLTACLSINGYQHVWTISTPYLPQGVTHAVIGTAIEFKLLQRLIGTLLRDCHWEVSSDGQWLLE